MKVVGLSADEVYDRATWRRMSSDNTHRFHSTEITCELVCVNECCSASYRAYNTYPSKFAKMKCPIMLGLRHPRYM